MSLQSILFLSVFSLLTSGVLPAQPASGNAVLNDTLNRTDEQGRRMGWWQIKAPVPDKPKYQAGELYEEGRYRNGRRVGEWKRYWPGGALMSEIHYVEGLPRGDYRIHYPDGRVEEQGTWEVDRNTGEFRRWHRNGNPSQEFVFNAYGQRNGNQRYYHENGKLAVEVTVLDGRKEGTLKRYSRAGTLQETSEFRGGQMQPGSFASYGQEQPEVPERAAADAQPAPAKSSGENTNASTFMANGWNALYDDQQRLTQEGNYRNGRLWNGKVYKYGTNGVLYRIEVYMEGRYVGKAPITGADL